jgi:hypothetical protein
MEIPEAAPKFLHYPHNHDRSHIHILQGESESVPCLSNNTLLQGRTRANTFDATPRSVDLSQAYSCAVIIVPCFC